MTTDNLTQPNRKTNSLDDFWMPFTANRQFKAKPRLPDSAEGMYSTRDDGRRVLDGTAGLWCCDAGHGRREITEAVSKQIAKLDFTPTLQRGHPLPFEPASRLAEIAPAGKIALACQRLDTLAMSPPPTVEQTQIDSLVEKLADSIRHAS